MISWTVFLHKLTYKLRYISKQAGRLGQENRRTEIISQGDWDPTLRWLPRRWWVSYGCHSYGVGGVLAEYEGDFCSFVCVLVIALIFLSFSYSMDVESNF